MHAWASRMWRPPLGFATAGLGGRQSGADHFPAGLVCLCQSVACKVFFDLALLGLLKVQAVQQTHLLLQRHSKSGRQVKTQVGNHGWGCR
jgi:hypothetical protein